MAAARPVSHLVSGMRSPTREPTERPAHLIPENLYMYDGTLARRIKDPTVFTVLVEFTCPPGAPPDKLLAFIERHRTAPPAWSGVEIGGITVTQNPGGGVRPLRPTSWLTCCSAAACMVWTSFLTSAPRG